MAKFDESIEPREGRSGIEEWWLASLIIVGLITIFILGVVFFLTVY